MQRQRNLLVAFVLLALAAMLPLSALAQPNVEFGTPQYYRPQGKAGLNIFEAPKTEATDAYDGLEVYLGGDFAIQFQGLSQSNDSLSLVELTNNFTLPTANLNVDVQFAPGMRMHLRTYLSSRHHPEAWVKGGYFQIDNLDFLQEDFLANVMEVTRFRFGMDEINYGDTHFRRSDNARAMYNPFVGNYIMDSFATEPVAFSMDTCFMVLNSGFIGVAGLSNGRLNQSPLEGDDGVAFFTKLGYDSQINEMLRARLTGSVYHSTDAGTRDYLYGGDRAGARYYNVLEVEGEDRPSDFLPRFNPGFPHQTAFQVNPFVYYQVAPSLGVEFFGVFERSMGGGELEVGGAMVNRGSYTQLGAELLFRLGQDRDFYLGGRYNAVNGEALEDGPEQKINRFNVGGGWFLTNNVMAKAEYVSSTYDGDGFASSVKYGGAEFNGFVLEAVISF